MQLCAYDSMHHNRCFIYICSFLDYSKVCNILPLLTNAFERPLSDKAPRGLQVGEWNYKVSLHHLQVIYTTGTMGRL